MIKQEISALFRELVKEVNGIYKTSDFAGQEGFQLRVDRLAVSFSILPLPISYVQNSSSRGRAS